MRAQDRTSWLDHPDAMEHLSEMQDWLDSMDARGPDAACWWVAAGTIVVMSLTVLAASFAAWWLW